MKPGYQPRSGDVVAVGRAASVQFDNGCGFNFRIARVTPSTYYDGWAWLDGYQLDQRGTAVARRSIFVQPSGLHPPRLRRGRPAGGKGNGMNERQIEADGFNVNLEGAVWRKSTRSGPYTDNCVEVAFVDNGVALRDSKDQDGPVLTFNAAEWDAFTGGVKDGEFDRV